MSQPNNERSPLNGQLRGTGMRANWSSRPRPVNLNMGQGSRSRGMVSCGACKHLKRKCVKECIFAPYFDPEQGRAQFAAIHKVFGARHLEKLLGQLQPQFRHQAVQSISHDARARLRDPVGGCLSIINNLSQQVASLQAELARERNKSRTDRLVAPNTLQGPLQQPEPMATPAVPSGYHLNNFQPMHSHGSFAANNNLVNMNMFDPNPNNLANNQNAVYAEPGVDPPLFTGPFFSDEEYLNFNNVEEANDPFMFNGFQA